MRMLHGTGSRVARLWRRLIPDARGSTIAMMAAALIPVIAALGAGIDMGRIYLVKSQLQAGADAGALAGARAFGVTDGGPTSRDKQALSYFHANFPTGYMGTQNADPDPVFKVVDGINTTRLDVTAKVPMTFMRIFGFKTVSVDANAKAELQPRPLEVMVVLDDTGSMRFGLSGGRTRMTALKEAARDFVDVLFQGSDQRSDLAMGFLAYDTTVNVGHLLEKANIPLKNNGITDLTGFNAGGAYYGGKYYSLKNALGDWPENPLAWKGCVMSDTTVKDLDNDRTYSEPGAWDLTRTLPGEGSNPPVDPYFVPPIWVPGESNPSPQHLAHPYSDDDGDGDNDNKYYKPSGSEPSNNLYRLDTTGYGALGAYLLANSSAYKNYFYQYYIGLNNGSDEDSDDVIVKNLDTGNGNYDYYEPGSGSDWVVNFSNVPFRTNNNIWKSPQDAIVNPAGGSVDNINRDRTPAPSPNWQCPEEAQPIHYGKSKNFYDNIIDKKNAAIYPGNGTLHHSGLLWGYRLLVRDDAFPRDNPTNETPRRALVFMTDGENQVAERQNGYLDRTYTWYGRWSDSKISSNQSNTENQSVRRFAKTCANIQREKNPPEIYIIALVTNDSKTNRMFNDCAPGHVYHTNSESELRKAFQDVGSELVDLHLVQ